MSGEAAGVATMAGAYLALFAAAEAWARLGSPRRAWPRKLVHVGCGFVSLLMPRFIDSPWSVLGMAAFFSAFCLAGRRAGLLRCLDGADRASMGSEIYPFSIFLLFAMMRDQYWIYAASLMTLAVADTGAALAGMAFGRTRYSVEDEVKSLEGSLVFLLLAFLTILAPMAALSSLAPGQWVTAALLAAALATGLEAVSLRGSDNLLVPLGVCVTLERLSAQPMLETAVQLAMLGVAGFLLAAAVRRLRPLSVGTALTLLLSAYGVWAGW